jgi:hypothetical protein
MVLSHTEKGKIQIDGFITILYREKATSTHFLGSLFIPETFHPFLADKTISHTPVMILLDN